MIAQYAKRRSALRTWTAVACLIVLAGVGLTDGVEGDAPPAKVNGPSDSDAPAHRSSTKSATRAIDNMTFSGHKVKVVPLPDGGTEIHADRVIFEPSTRRSNSSDGKGTIAIETYNPATNSIVLTPAPTTQRISDAEKTYAQFRKRLPEVKFDAIPFSDAVDFLRNITGLNIVVNTRALEASGIDMNMPISLRLKDVTLEQALRQLLQQAGGGTVSLGFGVQGNAVVISTSDSVPTRVRAYDVSDLLDGATTRPADRSEAANLVQLIEKNVAPDSWRDDGGTIGTISRFGQMLIISTTDMNHLEIDRLLAELRSAMPSHPGEAG